MNTSILQASNFNKVEYILASLNKGEGRNQLALELGYTNPKSLDIYMRRKGFLFDGSLINYVPVKAAEINESKTFNTNKRLNTILSLFTNEGADPKKIAEITGFDSHIELADFMKKNNFTWNDTFGNYIKISDKPDRNNEDLSSDFLLEDISQFYVYLPLLRKLIENKDKLYSILDSQYNATTLINPNNSSYPGLTAFSFYKQLNPLIEEHLAQTTLSLDKFLELAITEYLNNHKV